MNRITQEEAQKLIDGGHVVFPYPRKREIKVDGFKTYAATPELCAYVKAANARRLANRGGKL